MKTVLVTGASRGLGRSIILEYAKHGYNVVIHYREASDKASILKQEVEKNYHVRAMIVEADLKSEEEIDKMLLTIYKEFDHIDVLVNNAGIAIDNDFTCKTKEEFMKVLEVNLLAPYLLSKKVGLKMQEMNIKGTITNITSTNGIDTTYVESIDYDASKAGLISLTHNLAQYFAPSIRVNAIAPGWIETDMNKDLSALFIKKEEDKILLGRFAKPEEISPLVYFLSSDEAYYINDTIIRIDGGVRR